MMQQPVVVDGVPLRTERLSSVTGRHWLAWRFGGRWGRRYIIRAWLRYFRVTQVALDEAPVAFQFPDGWTYKILDLRGGHELLG